VLGIMAAGVTIALHRERREQAVSTPWGELSDPCASGG
jgi:hypothetical protein